ncbi:aldose 1-epimerase family protein [bacterium RCC_150]
MSEYEIRSGDYRAVITERGAALRQLRHRGRDLVVPFPAGASIPDYRGIIAAPWPNRIRDGRYRFDGIDYQLPVNESDRRCALHGLVFDVDWTLAARDDCSVSLSHSIEATAGYPFTLSLTATYRVDDAGLCSSVTAINTSENPAPYGVCPHPYLLAGPSPLDEWILEFPASRYLEVSPDRLLPTGLRGVDGHDFDFRAPRRIGTTEIDHAFTGITYDDSGQARLTVRDPGGSGVGMEWDRSCNWLQIHTADKPAPAPNRLGLAVEPMTCPPDAFNSREDLVVLAPGEPHEASWSIFAL